MRGVLGCFSVIMLFLAVVWFVGGIVWLTRGSGGGVGIIVLSVIPFLIFYGVRKFMRRLA